uniref:Uncharacterized protein n=1 Tax=Photinus pyralis TaxID=7054 RepID=A0A1Y1JRE3_PHOPY
MYENLTYCEEHKYKNIEPRFFCKSSLRQDSEGEMNWLNVVALAVANKVKRGANVTFTTHRELYKHNGHILASFIYNNHIQFSHIFIDFLVGLCRCVAMCHSHVTRDVKSYDCASWRTSRQTR